MITYSPAAALRSLLIADGLVELASGTVCPSFVANQPAKSPAPVDVTFTDTNSPLANRTPSDASFRNSVSVMIRSSDYNAGWAKAFALAGDMVQASRVKLVQASQDKGYIPGIQVSAVNFVGRVQDDAAAYLFTINVSFNLRDASVLSSTVIDKTVELLIS